MFSIGVLVKLLELMEKAGKKVCIQRRVFFAIFSSVPKRVLVSICGFAAGLP
jgi:hypothetical protein